MICDRCNNKLGVCGDHCRPARYSSCEFNIESSPYDPTTWMVTVGGMSHKVKVPKTVETDTTLRVDPSIDSLVYNAENHIDTIPGSQLGEALKMRDLKDVSFDDTLTGTCYELIYTKYADCGEGCISLTDTWHNFNINSDDAKKDYIKHVRGTNAYGCPEYLDAPTNTAQYWYAGWKTDGEHKQFGYFQPESSDPATDSNGRTIVVSQNQSTKKPIVGPLKISQSSLYSDGITSDITPASGFRKETGSITYYPHIKMAKFTIDFLCTSSISAQTHFNTIIGTIDNSALWPPSNYWDLPLHWVWNDNSSGAITPVAMRINTSGQVLLSGYVPARTTSGKAAYIALGIDDVISWDVN